MEPETVERSPGGKKKLALEEGRPNVLPTRESGRFEQAEGRESQRERVRRDQGRGTW